MNITLPGRNASLSIRTIRSAAMALLFGTVAMDFGGSLLLRGLK